MWRNGLIVCIFREDAKINFPSDYEAGGVIFR